MATILDHIRNRRRGSHARATTVRRRYDAQGWRPTLSLLASPRHQFAAATRDERKFACFAKPEIKHRKAATHLPGITLRGLQRLHVAIHYAVLLASAFLVCAALGSSKTFADAAPSAAEPAVNTTIDQKTVRQPIAQLKLSMTLHLGKTADWVAITDSAVWVGSTGPDAVHEIDPTSNRRVATVTLRGEPCAGLAVGFDSLSVPLCGRPGGLARVDLKTHRLVATYDVGPATAEGGVTTGAGNVWMVLESGALARIDPADGTVRQLVQVPSGSLNPRFREGEVWITRASGGEITSVDAATGAVIAHLPTGPHPRFLTAGNGAIWTLNQGDGTLSRIDPSGRRPTRTLALGTPGPGGDITYGDGKIWTTFQGFPLSVIDADAPALLCQWQGPGGDSLGFGHGSIWLTNYHAGTISRIALADIPPYCTAGPTAQR